MSGHSDAIMLVLWFPSNHIVLEVIKSPPTSMLSINPPPFPNSTCCTLISNMAQASSSRHQFEDKFDRFKNLFGQHMTRLSLHHEEPTEPVYAISYDHSGSQAPAVERVESSPPLQLPPTQASAKTNTNVVSAHHIAWLFAPRDDYQLHELRLRSNLALPSSINVPFHALLPILSPMLKDLKVLEVRLCQYVRSAGPIPTCPASFRSLIAKCNSLEMLHANVIDIPSSELLLSNTHRHLHTFQSFNFQKSANYDDERLAELLAPLLTQDNLPNLLSVNVSELTYRNEGWYLFTTEEVC